MENTLKKPMTGIIPPLVTPLLDNDKTFSRFNSHMCICADNDWYI